MNAVEIEEAVSNFAFQLFDAAEFAFQCLAAFSVRDIMVKQLCKGIPNQSDVAGGVLWRGNIQSPWRQQEMSARPWPRCALARRRRHRKSSSSSPPMAKWGKV